MTDTLSAKPVPSRPTINVAAGVVVDHDRMLITQRDSGRWEFPGGKLERGETPRQALHRELMEELGVSVSVGQRLTVVDHVDDSRRIILHTYLCRLKAGWPQAIEVADLAWVDLDELAGYDLLEADRVIVKALPEAWT